jgi:uncharacterized YigZ family protein
MAAYLGLTSESRGEYHEKGSKFLAFAYPILDSQEALGHVDTLRKAHPRARHVCYAYTLGSNHLEWRVQDDGEPNGSAGLPILNQLKSANLSFVLLAVVRYFGGTKLGLPGLVNAYKSAAKDAIEHSTTAIIHEHCTLSFTITYALSPKVFGFVKKNGAIIVDSQIGETCTFTLDIIKDEKDTYLEFLSSLGIPV